MLGVNFNSVSIAFPNKANYSCCSSLIDHFVVIKRQRQSLIFDLHKELFIVRMCEIAVILQFNIIGVYITVLASLPKKR